MGVRVLFEKHCRKTKRAEAWDGKKNGTRLWPLDIYHSSASTTTPNTIASTHIINPIQWHFTGERETFTPLLAFSHLTSLRRHSMTGSLSLFDFLTLLLSSQIVCKIYSRIQWEIHSKNKNKTQNIINFITRSEKESYRIDPAVVQTVYSQSTPKIYSFHSHFKAG